MASNTYIQHFADGTSKPMKRTVPQGRHKSADPQKVKMSFRASLSTKQRVLRESGKYFMTPSAYIDLALSLFDMELLSDKNC